MLNQMLFLLGFCPVVLFSLLNLDKMTLVVPPWGQLNRSMMKSSSLCICIKHYTNLMADSRGPCLNHCCTSSPSCTTIWLCLFWGEHCQLFQSPPVGLGFQTYPILVSLICTYYSLLLSYSIRPPALKAIPMIGFTGTSGNGRNTSWAGIL